MSIRMIDLQAEYLENEKDILPAITAVLKSGNYIQGQIVRDFEQDLANYLGVKHVISCANGTDALQIALMTIGVGAGDEVIIPAFSYIAVAEVVCLLGATPVFVDVDHIYFQLQASLVQKAITQKTKAIIPVHLFGQTANLEDILALADKYHIPLIEDNAQALGAKYQLNGNLKSLGTFGAFGCTSFFPTKNLSCFGDGGALFTNDDELAKIARMIANHGQPEKYKHHFVGINSRLDSLQARVLQVKLRKLNKFLELKSVLAERYLQQLKAVPQIELPQTHPQSKNSWHQFTIKVGNGLRTPLKAYLKTNDVESMIYYPMPIVAQVAYQNYKTNDTNSSQLCEEVLSLPIHPLLTVKDIDYICTQIKNFFDASS